MVSRYSVAYLPTHWDVYASHCDAQQHRNDTLVAFSPNAYVSTLSPSHSSRGYNRRDCATTTTHLHVPFLALTYHDTTPALRRYFLPRPVPAPPPPLDTDASHDVYQLLSHPFFLE